MTLSGTTLFISMDYSYNPTSSLLITFRPSQTVTRKWCRYKDTSKNFTNTNSFY